MTAQGAFSLGVDLQDFAEAMDKACPKQNTGWGFGPQMRIVPSAMFEQIIATLHEAADCIARLEDEND